MSDRNENAARAERKPWTYPYTADEIEAIAVGTVLNRANNPAPYTWSFEARNVALRRIAMDYAAALRSRPKVAWRADSLIRQAAESVDWQQVVGNGGPPCFMVEHGRFCLRSERWDGHPKVHSFISLASMLDGYVVAAALRADSAGDGWAERAEVVDRFLRHAAEPNGEYRFRLSPVEYQALAAVLRSADSTTDRPARAAKAEALTALLAEISERHRGGFRTVFISTTAAATCRAELAALTAEPDLRTAIRLCFRAGAAGRAGRALTAESSEPTKPDVRTAVYEYVFGEVPDEPHPDIEEYVKRMRSLRGNIGIWRTLETALTAEAAEPSEPPAPKPSDLAPKSEWGMTPGESERIAGYVRGVVGKAMHRSSDVAVGGEPGTLSTERLRREMPALAAVADSVADEALSRLIQAEFIERLEAKVAELEARIRTLEDGPRDARDDAGPIGL
jgi:hypothetical protein